MDKVKGQSERLSKCSDVRYRSSKIKIGKSYYHIWRCSTITKAALLHSKTPFEIVYGKEFNVPGKMTTMQTRWSRGATDTTSGAAHTEATHNPADCRWQPRPSTPEIEGVPRQNTKTLGFQDRRASSTQHAPSSTERAYVKETILEVCGSILGSCQNWQNSLQAKTSRKSQDTSSISCIFTQGLSRE